MTGPNPLDLADIEWVDPPPTRHGRHGSSQLAVFADALRAHPDQWALLRRNVAPNTVSHWRRSAAFRGGGFEFTSRQGDNERGRADIYGRYVGVRDASEADQ